MQTIGSVSWRIGATPCHRHVAVRTRHPVTSPAAAVAGRCESRGNRLFVFGLGFVGRYVSDRLKKERWEVAGTCTSAIRKRELEEMDLDAYIFDVHRSKLESLPTLQNATHLLISIPPIEGIGDPLLCLHEDLESILSYGNLKWLCYLSSTSVYGDCGGALVSEDYAVNPKTESAKSRVAAERGWLDLGKELGVPVYVFRLGGIYGPGRSALDTIIKQKSMSEKQTMRKSKLYTTRVHVADIYQAIKASFDVPSSGFGRNSGEPYLEFAELSASVWGYSNLHQVHFINKWEITYVIDTSPREIYNVVDDDPAPRAEVFAYAQAMIQSRWPDLIGQFQGGDAVESESQQLKVGTSRCEKRVSNARLKEQLGVELLYPNYKSGLQSILDCYSVGRGGQLLTCE